MNFQEQQYRIRLLALPAVLFFALLCSGNAHAEEGESLNAPVTPPVTLSEIGDPNDVIVKRTPKLMNADDPKYPCNDCHASEEDFHNTPRELKDEHTEKKVHFPDANAEGGWCHRCHKEGNYLKLKLMSGREINFNESYLLCGQCHGTEYRDWKKNIHGKRTGKWNGPRQVFSCPECHDPHEPAFQPLQPKPAPDLPRGKSKSFWKLLFGDMIHDDNK